MFRIQDTLCTHCNFCGNGGPMLCYAARTAHHGLEGNFPTRDDSAKTSFGHTQSGGEQFLPGVPRYKALRDLILVPQLLSTPRVAVSQQLGQEPLYTHVKTCTHLGGFEVDTPLIVAAMGSTPVANTLGVDLGMGVARGGFVCCIGENIVNMWGYDERLDPDQPTLKDRIRGFTDHYRGAGGIVIQQNVEDARVGVWQRVYDDPHFAPLFEQGVIGFEGKGGQGAKPGMGGEVKIDRRNAQRLHELYHFPVNPFEIEQSLYQRHSVPGTLTLESLHEQYTDMCRRYPKARIWFKTGPYGDLMTQFEIINDVARQFGIRIHVTVDGSEGGTGMSPLGPMNEMGLPTLLCLQAIFKGRQRFDHLDFSLAGGMVSGRDLIKILALGCDGMAMGKAFLIAASAGRHRFAPDAAGETALHESGARGVYNFAVEGVTNEARMLISSIGKYDLSSLHPAEPFHVAERTVSTIDVVSLDREVAAMFDLLYAYDPHLWELLTDAADQARQRCAAAADHHKPTGAAALRQSGP